MTLDTVFRSVRSWDDSSVANRSTKSERSAERKQMEQRLLRKSSSEELNEMLDGSSSRPKSPLTKALRSLSPIGFKAPSLRTSSVLRRRSKSPAPKLQELSSDSSVFSDDLRNAARDPRNISGASDDPRNSSVEIKKETVERIVSALGDVIAGAKEGKRDIDMGNITMSISFSDAGAEDEQENASSPNRFPALSIVGLDQVRGSSMNRAKSPVPSAVSDPSTAADTAVASNLSIDRRKSRKFSFPTKLNGKKGSKKDEKKKEEKKRLKKREKKRRAILERARRLDKAVAEDASFDDSVASGSYHDDIEGSLMTAFLDLIDPPRYEERSDNEEDTSVDESSESGSTVSVRSGTLDAIADLLFLQGDEVVTPPRKRSGRRTPRRRGKGNNLLKNLSNEPNIISAFMESKGVKVNQSKKSKIKAEDLEDPTGCALIFEESFFDFLSRFVDKADQKVLFCAGELCGEMEDVQSVAATSVADTVEMGYKNMEQSLDDLVNNLDPSEENSSTREKAIHVLKELKSEYPNLYERLMFKLGETMLKKEGVSVASSMDDFSNIAQTRSTLSNVTADVDAELEEINKDHGENIEHDPAELQQSNDAPSQLMSLWKRATSPLVATSRPTSPLSLANFLGPRKSPTANQTPVMTNKSKKGPEDDCNFTDSNTAATSLESEIAASRTIPLVDDNSDDAPLPESGVKRLLRAARKSPITLPKLGSFKRPKTPNQTPITTNKANRVTSYDFQPNFVEESNQENDANGMNGSNSAPTEQREPVEYPDYIITKSEDDASVLSAPEAFSEWQDFGSSPFNESSGNRSKSSRAMKRSGGKTKRPEHQKLIENRKSSDFCGGAETVGKWEQFSSSAFGQPEVSLSGEDSGRVHPSSPLKTREAAHAALRNARVSVSKVDSTKRMAASSADVTPTGASSMYTKGDEEFDMFDHGMYSKSYL